MRTIELYYPVIQFLITDNVRVCFEIDPDAKLVYDLYTHSSDDGIHCWSEGLAVRFVRVCTSYMLIILYHTSPPVWPFWGMLSNAANETTQSMLLLCCSGMTPALHPVTPEGRIISLQYSLRISSWSSWNGSLLCVTLVKKSFIVYFYWNESLFLTCPLLLNFEISFCQA